MSPIREECLQGASWFCHPPTPRQHVLGPGAGTGNSPQLLQAGDGFEGLGKAGAADVTKVIPTQAGEAGNRPGGHHQEGRLWQGLCYGLYSLRSLYTSRDSQASHPASGGRPGQGGMTVPSVRGRKQRPREERGLVSSPHPHPHPWPGGNASPGLRAWRRRPRVLV